MRSMELIQLIGVILHGNNYLWLKKSSVSRRQRITYFQILCYVLETWIRTQHQILFGKNSWVGSKIFTTIQNFGHNWRRADEIREIYFRIIFMSMFNDVIWGSADDERECIANATLVSVFAKRFPAGRWSFLGPGSEKKWYSTHDSKPQGEWDRVAELMMIKFSESGHPVFRATSPLSRGTLKTKGGGKLSIHFCAVEIRLKLFFAQLFLLISSVSTEQSQVCVKNTNSAMLEQGDLFWKDNLTHCLCRQVRWWKHQHLRPMILRKKICCRSTNNEWKGSHNKTEWSKFVQMQDSWQQLKSDSTSWQKTLKNSQNLQSQ